jgi:O-antigen ligase
MGAVALVVLLALGGAPKSEFPGRDIEGGHVPLFEGGVDLFEDRPFAGWGSGSFGAAFYEQVERTAKTNVSSHAEPVSVASEQGVVGLVVYVALVVLALVVMLGANPGRSFERSAVAACFVTMLVHSLGYAAFAIDPATWTLLALGVVLRARAT